MEKEPTREEIYNSVYEVLDTIEKKKEDVIKIFLETEELEVNKETINKLKLVTFPEDPDYSELFYNDEKVITFRVNYEKSVPFLEVEASPLINEKLKVLAESDRNKLF